MSQDPLDLEWWLEKARNDEWDELLKIPIKKFERLLQSYRFAGIESGPYIWFPTDACLDLALKEQHLAMIIYLATAGMQITGDQIKSLNYGDPVNVPIVRALLPNARLLKWQAERLVKHMKRFEDIWKDVIPLI
jgi:hypothetical protein